MLSWLAITYNTARLGLEAQNAAAFRRDWSGAQAKRRRTFPKKLPSQSILRRQ